MEHSENLYDVIVVGGGPSGLSAAIYMARAKYRVLVLEKEKFGGQITITSEVVNYPGVFKTSGTELTANMQQQAERFGAEFKMAEVLDIATEGDIKTVRTSAGEFQTLGIILALGANPRKLGFAGEKEFQGRGVAYCATCDGEFFKGMEVYVIGGGFAAVEEGIFLTKYATRVHMIVREDDFTCAKTVAEHVYENEKIDVRFNTEVQSVAGEGMLQEITLVNNLTGVATTERNENSFGVFVFAGYVPNTGWLPEAITKDRGYIVTDANQKTNMDAIYASGDVCIKNLRQVVTAVSDGAIAATSLEKEVQALHEKLDLPDFVQKKVEHKEAAPAPAASAADASSEADGAFISAEIKQQLQPVFARFENAVKVVGNIGSGTLGQEIKGFVAECAGLSDKIVCETVTSADPALSYIELLYADGSESGIKFRAIPGGHEFNSFILALYSVAGPGKEMQPEDLARVQAIATPVDIKILISLSCTMCPEVVVGAQQIAARSPHVRATMIDLQHAPDLKEKYKVMSVPCMIVNDEVVHFGKKNASQILDVL